MMGATSVLGLKTGSSLKRNEMELYFRTFGWMFRNLGGMGAAGVSGPLLPTSGYFPLEGAKTHDWASEVFGWVKRYAGLSDWPAELQQGARKKVIPAGQLFWSPKNDTGGFGRKVEPSPAGDSINIIYHPELLNDPVALIAKLACDAAYHAKTSITEPEPEGWDFPEELTELIAIHMGFGVIVANSMVDSSRDRADLPHGWRWKRQNYLTESEALFALATFSYMSGTELPHVLSHLRASLREEYGRAYRTVKAKSYKVYAAIQHKP